LKRALLAKVKIARGDWNQDTKHMLGSRAIEKCVEVLRNAVKQDGGTHPEGGWRLGFLQKWGGGWGGGAVGYVVAGVVLRL